MAPSLALQHNRAQPGLSIIATVIRTKRKEEEEETEEKRKKKEKQQQVSTAGRAEGSPSLLGEFPLGPCYHRLSLSSSVHQPPSTQLGRDVKGTVVSSSPGPSHLSTDPLFLELPDLSLTLSHFCQPHCKVVCMCRSHFKVQPLIYFIFPFF